MRKLIKSMLLVSILLLSGCSTITEKDDPKKDIVDPVIDGTPKQEDIVDPVIDETPVEDPITDETPVEDPIIEIEVTQTELKNEFRILLDTFDTDFQNSQRFKVNQLIAVGDLTSTEIMWHNDLTLRSTLLYSEEDNYLYFDNKIVNGSSHDTSYKSNYVEIREENEQIHFYENYNEKFFSRILDNFSESSNYLNMFLYKSEVELSDSVVIEKLDYNKYNLIVDKESIVGITLFEDAYTEFNYDDFDKISITYTFDNDKLEMDLYLEGAEMTKDLKRIDFHLHSVVELVDSIEMKNISQHNSCYVMNSSIEEAFIVFEANENIKVCSSRTGDNYLAVHLPAGNYKFNGDYNSVMPDKVLDAEGNILYEKSSNALKTIFILDTEQTVYIFEDSYLTNRARTVEMRRVYIDIETIENIPLTSGTITSTIESEDDYSYYIFEAADTDMIMYVTLTETTVPIYDSTRVYISSVTGGCNISNCTEEALYVNPTEPFYILTRGNRTGTLTFDYYFEDTGILSNDINNPTDITTFSDHSMAVSNEINGNLYISFEVTETGNYLLLNTNFKSVNKYLSMNLYNENGTLLVEGWNSYTELAPDTYIVEYVGGMYYVLFEPQLSQN